MTQGEFQFDAAKGKVAKYLELVDTQDAWIESGTGNLAYMWVKPRYRRPIDRLSKRKVVEIISNGVSLIKTIDADMLPLVAVKIYKVMTGKLNPLKVIDWLVDECNVSEPRAYVILIDQLTKAREMMKVEDWKNRGIRFAMWRHRSGVNEPRDYHRRKWNGKSGVRNGRPNGLDGFVFSLDKPPVIDLKTGERGFPSTLVGCRCYLTGVRA